MPYCPQLTSVLAFLRGRDVRDSAEGAECLSQPAEFCLSAGLGSLLVVAVAVLRIYLGWAYVGDRLLSAAVEYEETGWYDGQVFVKPPEVLARDRLLGSYEVRCGVSWMKLLSCYFCCPTLTCQWTVCVALA